MSALFGVFNLDGQPIAADACGRLRESLGGWEPDSSGDWSEGSISLGQQTFHGTPEAPLECFPVVGGSPIGGAGQLVLVANLRLDNREQLGQQLVLDSRAAATEPDGALLLKAYEKWGDECAAHLLGDWAFALWDRGRRRLLLGRDYLGSAGLYYYQDERRFVFASSLPALMSCPEVPSRLNPLAIAQFSAYGKRDAATCYAGVFCVPPAHTLAVTANKTAQRRYWHPQAIRPVWYRTQQDYVEAFREIYTRAVHCRLRSLRPVGILLSGGLDSASVAALAAPELARRGQVLSAFTCVPRFDAPDGLASRRTTDESELVEAIRAGVGNIDVTLVPTAAGPLAGIRWTLNEMGQPSYTAASGFWLRAALERAQARGIGTLLTGDWGNCTISWSGERLPTADHFLDPWRWPRILREAREWRRAQGASVAMTLRQHFAVPLALALRARWAGQFLDARSVVRSGAARSVIRERRPVLSELEALRRGASQPLASIYNMSQHGGAATMPELCRALRMEVRTPPLDQRVVEFCLGLPLDCYARGGRTRLLIRQAMQGLLPPSVLWNERRGQIAADLGHWAQAEQSDISAALRELQASPLARHWLDLPAMVAGFERLRHRIDERTLEGFGATLRGLVIGLFLLRFERD